MISKGIFGVVCFSVVTSVFAGNFSLNQTYGTQDPNLFNSPVGIVEGSSGNYYVADTGNGIIRKFDAAGTEIAILGSEGNAHGELNAPMDISFKNGLLYIPELGSKRVTVMDEDGNLIRVIGEGDLEGPRGVWVEDNGDVTVLDEFGYSLVKYTAEGNYLSECNDGLSSISYNNDLIKINGNYFVTDATFGHIVEIGNNCGLVAIHGSYGSGPGQYNIPRGISTDGEFIYVSDSGNSRVQKLDLSMQYIETIGGPGQLLSPNQTMKHSSGVYIVTSTSNHQLQVFDPAAPAIAIQTVGNLRSAPGVFSSPSGMDVDFANAELYVANAYNHRIEVLDVVTGAFKRSFGQLGFGATNGDMLAPTDILVQDNQVLISNRFLNKVSIFDKAGLELGSFGTAGAAPGQLNQPYGIAGDSDGAVYIVDFGNNRLQKFDSGFNLVWSTAGYGAGPGEMWAPIRVIVTDDGRVLVAEAYNNRVQVLNAETGEFITSFGSAGSGPGELSLPFGLAMDLNQKTVMVSEVGNNRVSVFSLNNYSFINTVGQIGSRAEDLFFPYDITLCVDRKEFCISNSVSNEVKRFKIKNK